MKSIDESRIGLLHSLREKLSSTSVDLKVAESACADLRMKRNALESTISMLCEETPAPNK